MAEMRQSQDQLRPSLMAIYHLDEALADCYFRDMWLVVHGLATLIVTDSCPYTDAEMSAILKSDGIQMTGGLSQMPRLSEYLTERTGFPFHPTKNPAQAVMRGLLEMQKSRPPKLWRRA